MASTGIITRLIKFRMERAWCWATKVWVCASVPPAVFQLMQKNISDALDEP